MIVRAVSVADEDATWLSVESVVLFVSLFARSNKVTPPSMRKQLTWARLEVMVHGPEYDIIREIGISWKLYLVVIWKRNSMEKLTFYETSV